jgi:molybdopterin converting factor small subunit
VAGAAGPAAVESGLSNVPLVIVKIELYGVVRDLIRDSKVELRLDERTGATFRTVLKGLARNYGPALHDRLFDRYGLSSFVKVFAGGRMITDLDQVLPDQDGKAIRIIVFAAAGGG